MCDFKKGDEVTVIKYFVSSIYWNNEMKKKIPVNGIIVGFGRTPNNILVKIEDGGSWYYPIESIIPRQNRMIRNCYV